MVIAEHVPRVEMQGFAAQPRPFMIQQPDVDSRTMTAPAEGALAPSHRTEATEARNHADRTRAALAVCGLGALLLIWADARLSPLGWPLYLLVCLRAALGIGALWLIRLSCGSMAPGRLNALCVVWQSALIASHLLALTLWPTDLPAHVAGLTILLSVLMLMPNSIRVGMGLGLVLTMGHLALPWIADGKPPEAALLIGCVALNAAAVIVRMREAHLLSGLRAMTAEAERLAGLDRLRADTEAEAAAAATQQRMERETLMAALPYPVAVIRADGTAAFLNPAAREWAAELAEAQAEMWLARIGVGDVPGSGLVTGDMTDRRGQPRPMSAMVRPATWGGTPVRIAILHDDRDTLRTRSAALPPSRMTRLLNDLRTPLNGLLGFTRLLSDTDLTADQRAAVDQALNLGRAMEALLDRMGGRDPAPRPSRPGTGAAPTSQPSHRLNILLVEDDEVSAILTRTLLEREGHTVTLAVDGYRAVQLASDGGFDLILMDLQLPRLGGLAAARRIRALPDPAAARVPIIAMTVDFGPEQIAACRTAGIVRHVVKPLDIAQLRALLTQAGGTGSGEVAQVPPSAPQPRSAGAAAVPGPSHLLDARVLDDHLEVLGAGRLTHVVSSFLSASPETVQDIGTAAAADDLSQLARASHKLGSGALTVGLGELAKLARATEQLAKAGDAAGALAEADRLREIYRPSVAALAAYLEKVRA